MPRRMTAASASISRERSAGMPAGHGWVHEIKHDGFRILARRQGDRVRLFTRNGYDFTHSLPEDRLRGGGVAGAVLCR